MDKVPNAIDIDQILDAMCDVIVEHVAQGDSVHFRKIGTFYRRRNTRIEYHNVNKQEGRVFSKTKYSPRFNVSAHMSNKVHEYKEEEK